MRYHTQTTDSLDKFNGREGKQHMAVCRISFVCFVNKFPPESALTPPARPPGPGQKAVKMLIFSRNIFNLFWKMALQAQFCLNVATTAPTVYNALYSTSPSRTVLLLQVILYISVTIMSRKDPQKEIYQRKRVTEEQATLWNILVSELKLCKRYWESTQIKVEKLLGRVYGFIYFPI